jgi:predicted Zn finger-like uncharacterized protein
MFTICPQCKKQFQLYAEHIAAASGQVRCGFCNTQFNALEYLRDKPVTHQENSTSAQTSSGSEQDMLVEPEFDLSEANEDAILVADNGLLNTIDESNNDHVYEPEPEFEVSETEGFDLGEANNGSSNTTEDSYSEYETAFDFQRISGDFAQGKITGQVEDLIISSDESNKEQELSTAINEIGVEIPDKDIDNNTPESVESYASERHLDFPDADELLEEPSKKSSWVSTFFWTSTCTLGLLVLLSQLLWFNRDQVLLKYPELMPYAKQVCNKLDCRVIRQRDARAIKLVNRDVRLHPDYEDTLLVNATMNNQLAVRQPYPRVQLTLFDTSGALLGYRDFAPGDYLDASIDLDEGMPVNIPVHFVLQVSGPTAGAVSFEFRFL